MVKKLVKIGDDNMQGILEAYNSRKDYHKDLATVFEDDYGLIYSNPELDIVAKNIDNLLCAFF
jgi:hypothetical protein